MGRRNDRRCDGKKMSKPNDERSGDAAETYRAGGSNENSPRRSGRDPGHGGQSKIDSYLSPKSTSIARSPLQEENSVSHNEGKYQGKASTGVRKKADVEKIKPVVASEVVNGIEQKPKECNSAEASPDQKQSVPESHKKTPLPPAAKTSEPQKMVKPKSNRRKAQGTKSPNRKVTDYFPVRRSCRKNKKELEIEEKRRIDDLILRGIEEGMKIDIITGKGRGVIATRSFQRGEFVVEYHGDLIETTDAKRREALYAQDSSTGCYMYYFQYSNKTYCVDATKETGRLGRLINHSKNGNCHTKLHDIDNIPHLILIASRDIKAGEELLYDYGDRSKSSIEAHPWLKN
ncbi:N-lysine methyltransferase KMT5A [Dendropsophus ebraccatus]|uniref:N-lysine methyltransferase KMT5A n=1 Tax=Dendropsophus ebraccatus TaxID=150705 RepID=UPI003831DB06